MLESKILPRTLFFKQNINRLKEPDFCKKPDQNSVRLAKKHSNPLMIPCWNPKFCRELCFSSRTSIDFCKKPDQNSVRLAKKHSNPLMIPCWNPKFCRELCFSSRTSIDFCKKPDQNSVRLTSVERILPTN